MKIIISYIITIFLFSTNLHSQTERIYDKKFTKDYETKTVRREVLTKEDKTRQRILIDEGEGKYERKSRNPIEKLPQRKNRIEPIELFNEEFEDEKDVIESANICYGIIEENEENDYHNNPNTDISRNPYPVFPLKFSNAEINYLYTRNSRKYFGQKNYFFELKFSIKLSYESYFHTFGILIKYANGNEKLLLFNRNNNILLVGGNYEFRRRIKINQFGYINVLLGFYDEFDGKFYEEQSIPNKNDLLVFVQKPILTAN